MKNLNTAVLELYKKGYSYNQIAKELGISKSKAYRIINETVDVSKNETTVEHPVLKQFQNVPKQPEKAETGRKYNAESLKLQVKMRKMELIHEAEMKRLEFEEQEKKRDFELENNHIQTENFSLKNQIEILKQQIFELENEDEEENFEDDTLEEEYIPELDIMIKDEIKSFFTKVLETDKFYKEELEELIVDLSNFKVEITEQAENEDVDADSFQEFQLLKGTEEVIKYFIENFYDYTSFFGSRINLVLGENLFSQIEEYANNFEE